MNEVALLSDEQFVEHRVFEDDVAVSATGEPPTQQQSADGSASSDEPIDNANVGDGNQDIAVKGDSAEDMLTRFALAVDYGLQALELFDTSVEGTCMVEGLSLGGDRWNSRPLPAVISSEQFLNDANLGLCSDDEESEEEASPEDGDIDVKDTAIDDAAEPLLVEENGVVQTADADAPIDGQEKADTATSEEANSADNSINDEDLDVFSASSADDSDLDSTDLDDEVEEDEASTARAAPQRDAFAAELSRKLGTAPPSALSTDAVAKADTPNKSKSQKSKSQKKKKRRRKRSKHASQSQAVEETDKKDDDFFALEDEDMDADLFDFDLPEITIPSASDETARAAPAVADTAATATAAVAFNTSLFGDDKDKKDNSFDLFAQLDSDEEDLFRPTPAAKTESEAPVQQQPEKKKEQDVNGNVREETSVPQATPKKPPAGSVKLFMPMPNASKQSEPRVRSEPKLEEVATVLEVDDASEAPQASEPAPVYSGSADSAPEPEKKKKPVGGVRLFMPLPETTKPKKESLFGDDDDKTAAKSGASATATTNKESLFGETVEDDDLFGPTALVPKTETKAPKTSAQEKVDLFGDDDDDLFAAVSTKKEVVVDVESEPAVSQSVMPTVFVPTEAIAASSKVASPRVASPKVASPRVASPKAASPKTGATASLPPVVTRARAGSRVSQLASRIGEGFSPKMLSPMGMPSKQSDDSRNGKVSEKAPELTHASLDRPIMKRRRRRPMSRRKKPTLPASTEQTTSEQQSQPQPQPQEPAVEQPVVVTEQLESQQSQPQELPQEQSQEEIPVEQSQDKTPVELLDQVECVEPAVAVAVDLTAVDTEQADEAPIEVDTASRDKASPVLSVKNTERSKEDADVAHSAVLIEEDEELEPRESEVLPVKIEENEEKLVSSGKSEPEHDTPSNRTDQEEEGEGETLLTPPVASRSTHEVTATSAFLFDAPLQQHIENVVPTKTDAAEKTFDLFGDDDDELFGLTQNKKGNKKTTVADTSSKKIDLFADDDDLFAAAKPTGKSKNKIDSLFDDDDDLFGDRAVPKRNQNAIRQSAESKKTRFDELFGDEDDPLFG
ncbi:MAG: hypothetical protein MHM6MM_001736 [Cercozoa sp. M6MM]